MSMSKKTWSLDLLFDQNTSKEKRIRRKKMNMSEAEDRNYKEICLGERYRISRHALSTDANQTWPYSLLRIMRKIVINCLLV